MDHLLTSTYINDLHNKTEQKFGFPFDNLDKCAEWRLNLREKLVEVMGSFPEEKCDLAPVMTEMMEFEKYTREKVYFFSEINSKVAAYVYIPKNIKFPAPAVIAQHGHGRGKIDSDGYYDDLPSENWIKSFNFGFASRFAEKGYVVIAPDAKGFGEMREPNDGEGAFGGSCRQISRNALLLGKTIMGMRVWDLIRSLDYLSIRPEVDVNRIGCMGLSTGGTLTMYLSALDDRVKAVIISCSTGTCHDSLMTDKHCICNYIPGLLKFAELYDILALISPRPLLIEAGSYDLCWPITSTKVSVTKVESVYQLLDAGNKFRTDLFEGGHKFSGLKSFDWFDRWL